MYIGLPNWLPLQTPYRKSVQKDCIFVLFVSCMDCFMWGWLYFQSKDSWKSLLINCKAVWDNVKLTIVMAAIWPYSSFPCALVLCSSLVLQWSQGQWESSFFSKTLHCAIKQFGPPQYGQNRGVSWLGDLLLLLSRDLPRPWDMFRALSLLSRRCGAASIYRVFVTFTLLEFYNAFWCQNSCLELDWSVSSNCFIVWLLLGKE